MAVEIETPLNHSQVKNKIINPIETELKRVRTSDKYAPRTIDIDMIFFNQELIDPNLWDKLFIALPVSEIDPNIKNEKSGETIRTIVKRLKRSAYAERFN
jgi:2-amino-4-hydroxy-6-hydroxymethyldihydropteridine diphosphokinase